MKKDRSDSSQKESLGDRIKRANLERLLKLFEREVGLNTGNYYYVDKPPRPVNRKWKEYKDIGRYIKENQIPPEICRPLIEHSYNNLLDKYDSTREDVYLKSATMLFEDFLQ